MVRQNRLKCQEKSAAHRHSSAKACIGGMPAAARASSMRDGACLEILF